LGKKQLPSFEIIEGGRILRSKNSDEIEEVHQNFKLEKGASASFCNSDDQF
jgi:hypothetical protein